MLEQPAGTIVVYPGYGLARVVGITEIQGQRMFGVVDLRTGTEIGLPTDRVERVLRRPVSRREAERLVALLRLDDGDSDRRPFSTRYDEYLRVILEGSLEDQVRTLHRQYRSDRVLSFGERKLLVAYEDVVLGELAHSLGIPEQGLLDELHAIHPAFRN